MLMIDVLIGAAIIGVLGILGCNIYIIVTLNKKL